MMNDMPVGIPFLLKKKPNGNYTHELATDRKDYSRVSLDFLNYTAYAKEFQTPDGSFYLMRTIVNGEKEVVINGKKYRVDGYVKTPDKEYFIEFHGCR